MPAGKNIGGSCTAPAPERLILLNAAWPYFVIAGFIKCIAILIQIVSFMLHRLR